MVFFLFPPAPVAAGPSTAERGRLPRVVEEEPVRERACWKTLLEEEEEEEEDTACAVKALNAEEEEEEEVVEGFLRGGA